jgi:hypothetical protein
MTRSPHKVGERFFAEEAAKFLGKEWCLGPDRENPDFIVTEGERQFGLEVTYLFAGPQDEHGSHRKMAESNTQKAVNAFEAEYEKKDDTPLAVKLVGDMCRENVDESFRHFFSWIFLPSRLAIRTVSRWTKDRPSSAYTSHEPYAPTGSV